jgi:hypothetical protein
VFHERFLPALFGEDITDNVLRRITNLPAKKAGLAIPNPMETVDMKWTASTVICGHLITAIRGIEKFWLTDHTSIMNVGKVKTWARYLSEPQEKLTSELQKLPFGQSRNIQRGEQTGACWSSLPPSMGLNSHPKSS